MSSSPNLKLDWCSYQAARYAVMHWHYSKVMPNGKLVAIGVWEDESYIGAILFGLGGGAATDGRRWGLAQTFEVAELVRVALRHHHHTVSRIVGIAIKMLKRQSPGLRCLVSYADPFHNHNGGIYQAMNWVYTGQTGSDKMYKTRDGRLLHSRVVTTSGVRRHFGKLHRSLRPQDCITITVPGKHRYLYPLDEEVKQRILPLSKPYPKRATNIGSDVTANHAVKGGATPTVALQTTEVL